VYVSQKYVLEKKESGIISGWLAEKLTTATSPPQD
jgi:hypothetical protein